MEKNKTFEENLNALAETVETLEQGELPLKETIEKFEQGLKLSKLCTGEIESAEQKIEKIMEKDGKIKTELFDVDA